MAAEEVEESATGREMKKKAAFEKQKQPLYGIYYFRRFTS